MPQYEYCCKNKECKAHEKVFEVKQGILEDEIKTCNKCGEDSLDKLISSCGFKRGQGAWESNNYEHGSG